MNHLLSLFALLVFPLTTFASQTSNIPHLKFQTDISNGSYKICIIGDTGTGSKIQYIVGDALAKENCDQIRILGDAIYNNGLSSPRDGQFLTKFYFPYREVIASPKVPKFFLTLGNHDTDGNWKAWLDISKDYPFIVFPHKYYSESWGKKKDVCFVAINSAHLSIKWWQPPYTKSKKKIMQKSFRLQKQWILSLKNKLRKNCKFSIVTAHHPYLSSGKHDDAKGILKKFLKNHIIGAFDMYLAGHDHQISDEGSLNDTRLLISGAAAKLRPLKRTPGVWGKSAYGYATLKLTRDKGRISGHYRFVEVEGGFDRFGIPYSKRKTTFTESVTGKGIRDNKSF